MSTRYSTRYEDFRVTGHIPACASPDGSVAVRPMEVSEWEIQMSWAGGPASRGTRPGTFTKLVVDGTLWMSDVQAEYIDHFEAIEQAHGRVLLNGLGLGCVLKAILAKDSVEHVDVVEIDRRVIDLMVENAPWVTDERVTVHHDDAFSAAKSWAVGTRWDVAWHDVWLHLTEDNLAEMARLHRSYGRRVGWQGSWGKELLELNRRRAVAWW